MKENPYPMHPDAAVRTKRDAKRISKRRLARQLIVKGKRRRRALIYAFVTGSIALTGIALLLE